MGGVWSGVYSPVETNGNGRHKRRVGPSPSSPSSTDLGDDETAGLGGDSTKPGVGDDASDDDDDEEEGEVKITRPNGGATNGANGTAEKDPDSKHRPFAKRTRMFIHKKTRRCACAQHTCAALYQICCLILAVLVIVLVVMLFIVAMTHVTNTPASTTYVTVLLALPTATQWEEHQSCVETSACNLCGQAPMLSLQPQQTRVVLWAAPGAGSLMWRHTVQQATRLKTTVDVCDVDRPAGFNPFYSTTCAMPMLYSHSIMTHLTLFDQPVRDFVPTHLMLLVRNPFDEAMWAFHIHKTCSNSVALLSCSGKEASLADFATGEWEAFALDAAQKQMALWAAYDTSAVARKTLVYFEDIVANKQKAISALFEFVHGIAPNPSRGSACALASENPLLAPVSTVAPRDVFSSDLIAKICGVVKPKWDAKRWGEMCSG